MSDWKPRNLGGRIYYDPKEELKYWVHLAHTYPMVAVPVSTLIACIERRECGARTIMSSDEDGPIAPLEVSCRHPENHMKLGIIHHSNGYYNWKDH